MQILAAPELLVTIRATAGSVVSPTTSTHPRASHSPHRRSSVMVPGQLRNRSGMFGPMDAVLQAISDASRRTVMETLRVGPATVGELAALLPIARPGVSRHLRVLREAGLVDVRQEAQRRFYSLRPEPLAAVDEWLGSYRELWENRLDALNTEIARGKHERRSRK